MVVAVGVTAVVAVVGPWPQVKPAPFKAVSVTDETPKHFVGGFADAARGTPGEL
jgi:hypothetical protein